MEVMQIGILKKGTVVTVKGERGVVIQGHEPQWRCHKTKVWRRELQGADVALPGRNAYIHCRDIELGGPENEALAMTTETCQWKQDECDTCPIMITTTAQSRFLAPANPTFTQT